jgi:hypothetical protein
VAFPQVAATTEQHFASGTSITFNLPTPVVGQTWLLPFALRNKDTGAAPTFTGISPSDVGIFQQGVSIGFYVYKHVVTGSEPGTATMTFNDTCVASIRLWQLTGASDIEFAGTGGGSAQVLDPPSLDPSWAGTEDTLWVSLAATNNGTIHVTSFPTGYSNTGELFPNNSGRPTIGYGTREAAVASDDPSAFGTDAATIWTACTIAVRPAAATLLPPTSPTATVVT